MAANIAEQDKVRARHHLGYLNVEQAQTFVLGIPAAIQTQFVIEGAMNLLLAQAVPKFLQFLDRCDEIECELFGGIDLASITSIAEIVVNPQRRKELAGYYNVARQGLANMLGIIPNPFDLRDWVHGDAVNVPVING